MASPQTEAHAASPLHVTSTALAGVLEFSPDALIVVEPSGIIVQANEQAAVLFGYTLANLVGQRLEILVPERQRTQHANHRHHYLSAPRMRAMGTGLDLSGRRQDGSEFPVDISLRPVILETENTNTLLTIAAVRDVSAQQHAERERAQQAERLHLQAELINLAHDAILVRDALSRITFWNRGAETLYGWTAQQAQGRITHSLLHTRFPLERTALEQQLEREGHWEGELVHTCRDGRVVVVESRQILLRETQTQVRAILEINRDITRRRQLEQEAQAIHGETVARLDFLQQVLDALPSSVYLVTGPRACLLLANRAATSLWGSQWPAGQPMLDFLSQARITLFDPQGSPLPPERYATLRAVQSGQTVLSQQELIRRPDGSTLPVLVSALPLPTHSGVDDQNEAREPVALVLHQDVSVLKETEYLKDEFIAVAAHELRNPLAALKGFVNMLLYQTAQGKGPPLVSWQQEALEEIGQAVARLEKLTDDLLDVTRLQAGRLTLSRCSLDLVSLIQRVLTQAQMTTQHHTLCFQTTLSSLRALADRVRIEQVLANLLSNAIKYSPRGGVITVTLDEEKTSHAALIAVQDQGIGIPVDQQARLFGRFARVEHAQTAQIPGTGLGLYLCRELMERHGGQIWFHSTEGVGSTFFLRLPLEAAPSETQPS